MASLCEYLLPQWEDAMGATGGGAGSSLELPFRIGGKKKKNY